MGRNYYKLSELIIQYINESGAICKITTNSVREKGYIHWYPGYDSDDDHDTQHTYFMIEMERILKENTYVKMLYENDTWIKPSYEKKYMNELKHICPGIVKLVKVYKNFTAYEIL
jgi:hypothetical protein